MKTGNAEYTYKNDVDKACFQHDMADGNFKDLNKKHNQIKFSEIKPLKLQAIQNMMVIKED